MLSTEETWRRHPKTTDHAKDTPKKTRRMSQSTKETRKGQLNIDDHTRSYTSNCKETGTKDNRSDSIPHVTENYSGQATVKPTESLSSETDKETDSDLKLVENGFHYVTDKRYPPECTKNEKHSIRRKTEQLVVVNGDLFYRKKDGSEVRVLA